MNRPKRKSTIQDSQPTTDAPVIQNKAGKKARDKDQKAIDKVIKASKNSAAQYISSGVDGLAEAINAGDHPSPKKINPAKDTALEELVGANQALDGQEQQLQVSVSPFAENPLHQPPQRDAEEEEKEKAGNPLTTNDQHFSPSQIIAGEENQPLLQASQGAQAQKKKKRRKVAQPKTVKQGLNKDGKPVEIIEQGYYWEEYTPPESEVDENMSADESEDNQAPEMA